MFVAGRSMKVQGADGTMRQVKPGEPVPEAAGWPNLQNWINTGHILDSDAKMKPKRGRFGLYGETRAQFEANLRDAKAKPQEQAQPQQPEEDGSEKLVKLTVSDLRRKSKSDLLLIGGELGIVLNDSDTKMALVDAILEAQGE